MGAPIEVGGILKEHPQFLPDSANGGCFWMAFHQDHLSFLPMRLSYFIGNEDKFISDTLEIATFNVFTAIGDGSKVRGEI